jgi:hypothetical protein
MTLQAVVVDGEQSLLAVLVWLKASLGFTATYSKSIKNIYLIVFFNDLYSRRFLAALAEAQALP